MAFPAFSAIKHGAICKYGLLFMVGVLFGSIGMFYKSFELPTQTVSPSQYIWSTRENTYVPLLGEKSLMFKSVQYVLIVTYMRSGSSFTGDVIQHHPQSFYVFEPLITLFHEKKYTYLNGTVRNFTSYSEIEKESLKVLDRWYHCDLHNIDVGSYKSIFMNFGIHTNTFVKCLGKDKSSRKMLLCLPELIKLCQQSKLRVIKTIRMRMEITSFFFHKYSNFKVIHLLRDPRGTVNSRMHVEPKSYSKNQLGLHVRNLCAQIAKDMNDTKTLIQKYPTRIGVLKYEELAEFPYTTTAKIYNFLGTLPSLEIYGYIFCITSMGGVAERNYDIKRSDSVSTANKWKKTLSLSQIRLADSECKSHYELMGYVPVSDARFLKYNSTRIKILEEINYT